MLDLECNLVELFGWDLHNLDRTDIESLIPFFLYYPNWKKGQGKKGGRKMVYADQAPWL